MSVYLLYFVHYFVCHTMLKTLENTEGAIKERQTRETGNTGYTRQR